jgi:hypothetical protein
MKASAIAQIMRISDAYAGVKKTLVNLPAQFAGILLL